jgi:epsilon-lactone hydrolase
VRSHYSFGAALVLALVLTAPAASENPATKPTFDTDGTVKVPAFELPASDFLSAEARAQQEMRARYTITQTIDVEPDIAKRRKSLDAMMAPRVAEMKKRFPAKIIEQTIGGIPTRIITPTDKKVDTKRVLINLHGGAFSVCWDSCSLIESLPIASLGGYKVVSVNYRMAPEFAHPAGVEDVEAVYRELLKSYKAKNIGIFGCSAGGALTAHSAAWFPAKGLPQPGAIGIFGAGGARFGTGDSAFIAGYIDGSFPPPPSKDAPADDVTRGYFNGTPLNDPIISPALHPKVIAKFPPSLVITGTRAMDMSPAIVTNSALLRAGVKSTMIVGEGMGHCYLYSPQLPESQDAYAAIVAHFRNYLW